MKYEKSLSERIHPNPFLVGEIIFLASRDAKQIKIQKTDEQRLAEVRAELRKEVNHGT
jgi:hypothetical protein